MSRDMCERCPETCVNDVPRHHIGSPEGIRTLVAGLRSQSPRPLDDGALVFPKVIAYGFHFR
jgi:hypothetical protein